MILPLLALAEATGSARWLDLAAAAGRRMQDAAIVDADGARWPTPQFREPIGGFGHGAMGMGWALARLARSQAGSAAERAAWRQLAEEAFAFQAALFEPHTGHWRDIHLQDGQKNFPTWCHGSVGIGLLLAVRHALVYGAPPFAATLEELGRDAELLDRIRDAQDDDVPASRRREEG
ncbi:hypothetical protein G6F50_014941 [Rhizopus delemar]|uniref:Uncharacterized protein n=1 Tax=Rhizopus delemar TaxID=936053 RepID=A0A9P6Y118_9FUNG|nr:hypothetical protein G6F50_014941 [Rhizopus delemar]